MMIKRILFSTHRILGTILSILFVVWFLSGFVMIYHTFPKVTDKDRYLYADVLSEKSISIDNLLSQIQDKEDIIKLKLSSFDNKPYLEVTTSDNIYRISDSSTALSSYKQIENYAKKWNSAIIQKVDTLNKLEQWIPFSRYKKDFPVYKFYFADDKESQLYISSQTGEALQFTNKESRLWAWLGSIPHWIYFTSLRQDTGLWADVIIWLSGLGSIMCLTGFILGIYLYINRYKKKKKWGTPYTKFVYKWHHILGFFFGIFVFTFVFSGMMSLVEVPQWVVKTHNPTIQKQLLLQPSIKLDSYKLGIEKIVQAYPSKVKNIEWSSFNNKSLYKIIVNNELVVIEASTDTINLLNLKEQEIQNYIKKIHSDSIRITLLNEYDKYYITRKDKLPLPVYKVKVNDADKSVYYINPKTGNIQYFNNNNKARKWSYQALHSYKISVLVRNPILWNILMWTTMIGGTLVSLTGLWLTIKYLKRKNKKRKKYSSSNKKRNNICQKEE